MFHVIFKISHFDIKGDVIDNFQEFSSDDVHFFTEFIAWLNDRPLVTITDICRDDSSSGGLHE